MRSGWKHHRIMQLVLQRRLVLVGVAGLAVVVLLSYLAFNPTPAARTYLRGVNLAGGEFGTNYPGTYGVTYTYPTVDELDYYKSKGLTLIRLPFRWERLQPALYGPLAADDLARIDELITGARLRGMRVILDPHNHARYAINGTEYLIGSPEVPFDAFADFWHKLADHYKDEPAIWAYGLMNEPYNTDGMWPQAAQTALDAIRSVDMAHTILVPGDQWSGAQHWAQYNDNLVVHDPANNWMYEAHQYFGCDCLASYAAGYTDTGAYPMVGVDKVKPFVDWLKAHKARGFLGEYGVPDDDPRWLPVLDNFLSYLDQQGMSGTYYAGGPWWGDHSLSVEPQDGQDRPQMLVLEKHPSVQ